MAGIPLFELPQCFIPEAIPPGNCMVLQKRTLIAIHRKQQSGHWNLLDRRKANPVSFTVRLAGDIGIELFKQDADTKNPLDGAVYGIQTASVSIF